MTDKSEKSDKSEIKVISYEPRDIYIKFEISLNGLNKLLKALDCATISYSDPKLEESVKFLTEQFQPYLEAISKEFDNG